MNSYRDMLNLPRPASGRPRMPRRDRAKIFAPFAALRGHEEAIRARERTLVARAILSDCAREQVGRKLNRLCRRDRVTLTYFRVERTERARELGVYVTEAGTITLLDLPAGLLRLDRRTIPFRDIVDIQWD